MRLFARIAIAIASITAVACSSSDDLPSHIDSNNRNANTRGDKHSTRIEIPALSNEDIFITHSTTVNGKENITYSLAHAPERKHCKWTAFTFDASNRAINWKRDNWDNTEWRGDPFQPDPELPQNAVFTKEEINWNGYVRGHLVASYDRVYSKDANEQTFYYSNISPMISRFNTGLWSDLEGLVQGWGRNSGFCDTLYVVKGGTIREGEYIQDGTCITVPKHYFMAILCRYSNKYKAVGVMFEHKSYLPGTVSDYAMTIDELEEKTGIDFFCNLPDKLENAVEGLYEKSHWRGLN